MILLALGISGCFVNERGISNRFMMIVKSIMMEAELIIRIAQKLGGY